VSRARVGDPAPWRQSVSVRIGGGDPGAFTITPTSGALEIFYFDTDGVQKWWDPAAGAFTTEGPVVIDTTIVGRSSVFDGYEHQGETLDRTVTFRGWIGGGANPPDRNTMDERQVEVIEEDTRLIF
jgi:hypothetical protein